MWAACAGFTRFGWEVTRNSPLQADMIFVCGTIVQKMAPVLKKLYERYNRLSLLVFTAGILVIGLVGGVYEYIGELSRMMG